MFETYRVKPADNLWHISKARFGYGHLWPSIYSFNNWAAARHLQHAKSIIDPNLIHPRDLILIPDLDMHLLRPLVRNPRLTSMIDAADHAARGHTNRIDPRLISPTGITRDQRRSPAAYLHFKPFWALEYDLDDLKPIHFHAGPVQAEIKWGGKILMQPVLDEALVKLSNHGAVLSQELKANTTLGELSTGIDLTYHPTTRKLSFACNLTRAGHGIVPSITFEGDQDGPKFLLKWQPFSGTFQGYSFVAKCQAEITITAGGGGGESNDGKSGRMDRSIPKAPGTTIAGNQPAKLNRSIPAGPKRLVMNDPGHSRSTALGRSSGLAPLIGVLSAIGLGAAAAAQFIEQNPEFLIIFAAG